MVCNFMHLLLPLSRLTLTLTRVDVQIHAAPPPATMRFWAPISYHGPPSDSTLSLSRSSAEAEYRGVVNADAEMCWLRKLPLELHPPLTHATMVCCGNVSVVYLSSNSIQHQRTKYVELDVCFVPERVALGLLASCARGMCESCFLSSAMEDIDGVSKSGDDQYGDDHEPNTSCIGTCCCGQQWRSQPQTRSLSKPSEPIAKELKVVWDVESGVHDFGNVKSMVLVLATNHSLEVVGVLSVPMETEANMKRIQPDVDECIDGAGGGKERLFIAANQAMAVITRLLEGKATMKTEVLRDLRILGVQAEFDVRALEKLNNGQAEVNECIKI
ncbi:Retrovirus-related Pol polyprotein from transposon RE2-like protein [Drosera capensis]